MEEKDEDIEPKQEYLRKEIIDKGFNPDDFMYFLSKEKGDNAYDLSLWSLEELGKIVKNFQESQTSKKPEIQEKPETQVKQEKQEKTEKQELPKEEYLGDVDEDLWGNKIDKKCNPTNFTIKCKKLEPSDLIKERDKLKVHITDVEIKKDGLFSLSYNEFTIKNDLLNIDFKRKMNDFIWLKTKLNSFYPNVFIPPLPKFKVKKDEKYIQKKIYYLQSFINYIINNDILLSSQIFEDFISLSMEDFQISKRSLDRINPPKGIEDVITKDGNFDIVIKPEIDKKAYDINDDIQKKNELYNKLNISLKETVSLLFQLKQKFLTISTVFDELSQFYSKSNSIKNDRTNITFSKLKGVFSNCAEEYEKKMNYFEIYIRRFFKRIKSEISEFNYLYKNYDNARTTFIDVTERENVVYDDNFRNLQKYFGFTLNIIYKEYQNLNNVHNTRIKDHFSKTSKYLNL